MTTLKDIFLKYPHKCQEIYGKNVPRPYVKKQEIDCDHLYSVTYSEWITVMNCYFRYVFLYLRQGHKFKIPKKLGNFQLLRLKYPYRDFNTNTKKSNRFIGGDKFIIKWKRATRDGGVFYNKYDWRVKMTKTPWQLLFDNVLKFINNLNHAKIHKN